MKFKRIRKITESLRTEIDKLDKSELTKLISECRKLTTTNCGWVMYGLKKLVIGIAKSQRKWLEIQRKQKGGE